MQTLEVGDLFQVDGLDIFLRNAQIFFLMLNGIYPLHGTWYSLCLASALSPEQSTFSLILCICCQPDRSVKWWFFSMAFWSWVVAQVLSWLCHYVTVTAWNSDAKGRVEKQPVFFFSLCGVRLPRPEGFYFFSLVFNPCLIFSLINLSSYIFNLGILMVSKQSVSGHSYAQFA